MPFGTFALISVFYAVIGIRILRDVWVRRHEVFDRRFTEPDRYLVDQASFFLLVPISVLLHEFGHAVAIWSFGGEVIDFNYYVFAGSVSYREPFSITQMTVVAAAGTIVNIVLCALALAVVFLRRKPFRAAINELLFQFAVISGLNALIVYPLLDFATGMNGDWTQMYDSGDRTLTAIILVIHLGILFGAYRLWQHPVFQKELATRTGMPSATERKILGGLRRAGHASPRRGVSGLPANSAPSANAIQPASPAEARLRAAADRVAQGWGQPVQGRIDRTEAGSQIALIWVSGTAKRAAALRHEADGTVKLSGAAAPHDGTRDNEVQTTIRRELRTWPALPDENELTMSLRLAMEEIERWQPSPVRAG